MSVMSCCALQILSPCSLTRNLSSLTQLCSTISSLGTVSPHPWLQGTGFLGLCSHSFKCSARISSFTTTEHPYSSLSHLISSLLSKFLSILGTGLSSGTVMVLLSTGHVCCLFSHSWMQSAQKACSHSGASLGSSRTALQMGHMSSSSTEPSNLHTSYPMLCQLGGAVSCRSESSKY